jgi:nucleoside 2-deoxyribosyltransferase
MKIYIAHQISGLSGEEVISYFTAVKKDLEKLGYQVFSPMTGKGYFRTETKFKEHGYEGLPISTNHAIYERDKWMIGQADVVFANLLNMESVSIGCVMELAWASLLGKHTIVAMEKDNLHRHAFVMEAGDIIFEDFWSAFDYLEKLATGDMES